MIPTKKEDVQIESTVSGKSIRMSIDPEATADIISLLTDLYSDPEAAIIREVCTNALDSHIDAGQTRPIEVTLPSALQPIYIVQDWGLGLNADDFEEIYALYGKSTKKTTNEQTGSLGLGCKSPLTYTNQFTVVGVKDGIKTSAMVSRDEDGIPTIEVVDESPTDEPNGAKVVIATKRPNDLERKARKFFQWWPKGSVLLNGEQPEIFDYDAALKVSDRILFVEDNGYTRGDSILIMGNVAYPIDPTYLEDMNLGFYQFVVMRCDMGAVHFTPAREALNYTTRTKNVIAALVEEFNTGILNAAQTDIDAAATPAEGLRLAASWYQRIPRKQGRSISRFTYKGAEIPETIECPDGVKSSFYVTSGKKYDGKMSKVDRKLKISYSMVPNALWIYGFDRGFTPTCKKKLWQYCDENDIKYPEQFILSNKRVRSKWIDKSRQIPWAKVEAVKLPRDGKNRSNAGRLAGSYDMYKPNMSLLTQVPADEIDATAPVMWASSEDEAREWSFHIDKLNVFDDYSIVVLYPNRVAKFSRAFPEAERAADVYDSIFKTWWESVDWSVKQAMAIKRGNSAGLRTLMPRQVLDPAVRYAIIQSEVDTEREERIFGLFRRYFPLEWENPLNRYPLFSTDTYRSRRSNRELRQHNTIYINAAYQELYANA